MLRLREDGQRVDEVVATGTLEIERTGDARYVLRVRGEDEIDVAMSPRSHGA